MAFQAVVLPLVGAAGAAGFAAWAFYHRYYLPVPPGKALVLYGRRSVPAAGSGPASTAEFVSRNPRILVGGGTVVGPWNRGVGYLSLNPPATEANVRALHAVADGRAAGWEVALTVQVKIPTEPEALRRAAEHLLGKSDDEARAVVRRAVEGVVPALLARLPLEPGEPDWEHLAAEIEAAVAPELVDVGLVVRSVSVTGLRRIVPGADSTRAMELRHRADPLPAGASPGDADAEFALRLARVERGLGIMGAQVVRLLREPPPPSLEDPSLYDRPLATPASSAGVTDDTAYDSTGSGRPPRLTRSGAPRPSEEGA